MRILIVHNEYRVRSGEHIAVQAQVALLQEQGHEVRLFMRDNREWDRASWLMRIRAMFGVVYAFRSCRLLRRVILDWQPDLAHVHNVFPLLSPAVYRTLSAANIPIIQTVHNYRFMCANGLFLREGKPCRICAHGRVWPAVRYRCYRNHAGLSFLYAFSIWLHRRIGTFRKIDCFIALSAFARQQLITNGIACPEQVTVIPNYTDVPDEVPALPSGKAQVLSFGRLSEEKGVDLVLDVAEQLPGVAFDIAGGGPQETALRQAAEVRKLENVVFHGQVSQDRVCSLLQKAQIVLLTSRCYENLPFSLVEAMACGRIVAGPRQGAFVFLIADREDGILYAPDDVEGLVTLLQQIAEQPDWQQQMSITAHRKAQSLFSRSAHADQLQDLYAVSTSQRRVGQNGQTGKSG